MSSPIGWCERTWNPIVGCTKISEGCENCYAARFARRLHGMGIEKYYGTVDQDGWTGEVNFDEKELEKPFHWRKPSRIFVSSMGDLFHESVPDEWIDKVLTVAACCYWHTFLLLTKRAERMMKYFQSITDGRLVMNLVDRPLGKIEETDAFGNEVCAKSFYGRKWPLSNLWLGVTAENQEMADLRIPILLKIPAALRFVSIEPMLELIEIEEYLPQFDHRYEYDFFQEFQKACGEVPDGKPIKIKDGLDWVILGMETGPGARTFPGAAEAIVSVKDQCQKTGVPFFYKGPDGIGKKEWQRDGPEYYFYNEIGKKEKIHIIDGKEYRQFPEGK